MKVARAKGRLRGEQPKPSPKPGRGCYIPCSRCGGRGPHRPSELGAWWGVITASLNPLNPPTYTPMRSLLSYGVGSRYTVTRQLGPCLGLTITGGIHRAS